MSSFTEKLKAFLHDPVDKCFSIPGHIKRAKTYAEKLGISGVDKIFGPDWIASCMERSFLPKGIMQEFNEIRHPFCEGRLKIESFNKDAIFNSIERVYDNIIGKISLYEEKKSYFISGETCKMRFLKA